MALSPRELSDICAHPTAGDVAQLVAEIERQNSVIGRVERLVATWRNADHPYDDIPGQLAQAMLAARTDELDRTLSGQGPQA